MYFDVAQFVHLTILLVFAHFLADYPLQGDFLAKAKNREAPIPGVPWMHALTAHAGIHAGFVYLITMWWPLALLEFFCHWAIDDGKCRGALSFNEDQFLHLFLKVIWAAIVVAVAGVS